MPDERIFVQLCSDNQKSEEPKGSAVISAICEGDLSPPLDGGWQTVLSLEGKGDPVIPIFENPGEKPSEVAFAPLMPEDVANEWPYELRVRLDGQTHVLVSGRMDIAIRPRVIGKVN